MIYQHKNLSIILAGSFYPIHSGHIELLYSSKEYLELNNHKIVDMIILPTHIDSLGKKFVGINKNSDNRKEFIESFLLNHNKDNNINKITYDFGLIEKKEKNIGVGNYIKIIKNNLLEKNIRLIQICGVDSKINFTKNNNDIIIVDDGREIPENNKSIIKNLSNKIIKSIFYNKPPISSTIQRFINQELFDPHTISSFNWNWISSTEINIGSGVQGIVKLMLLGRLEVAVKFCYIDKKNTKEHFIESCELMSIFVKIYHYETFYNLGIIIYEIGTSLLEIIPIKYSYKNKNPSSQTNKFIDLVNKFIYEKIKKISNLQLENSNYYNEKQILQKYFIRDKNNFKLKIFDKLDLILDKLKKNNIIHRDINCSNLIIKQKSSNDFDLKIIDFGVAKKYNSNQKVLRGSLRYYPIISIDNLNFYDFNSDKYMSSFVIYEIIEEHEIYPECKGDTEKIINKRKNKEFPIWSNNNTFIDYKNKINKLWTPIT